MSMDDALDRLGVDKEGLGKWVGVYIGGLAVLLAICNMGGANAAKNATLANIEAANIWAYYQAKNIRRTSFDLAADELALLLATQQGATGEVRKAIQDKIEAHRGEAGRMRSDPKDGMSLLYAQARALEAERDRALRQDPYFDWSEALLQIAIVLASVHLIVGNLLLLGLSGSLAGLGILLMLNGYTLAVSLPFLG